MITDMGAEGVEETLQTAVDPLIRNSVFKENNNLVLSGKDYLESFLVGALSVGALHAKSVAVGINTDVKTMNIDIKLPDGTYVGADVINRYLGGNATESDVKQIKQLGSSINEENMNSVLKRMDDIANVKMGKQTYGEMNKAMAGMTASQKIDHLAQVMSSPEFKAHTEELIKTAQEVKNNSAEQAAVEEIRNKTINKLAEKSGYGIEKHDLGEGINGYIDKANNKIIVNNNSKASPILTMVHEITHGSENDNTYKDTVKQAETYLTEKGTDIDQYKQKIKDAYAKKGIELTQDGLNQEMVSKFLEENVYKSEADVMDMAFKNPSLAQKIYDSISNTVAKVGAGKATKALINAKANFEKAINNLPNTKTAEGSLQYKVSDENNDVSNGIDTDNGLSENKQVSNDTADTVETANQVSDMGINTEGKTDDNIINQESQNNAVGNENGIANGDGMGYKGEKENILSGNQILRRATFNRYVKNIAKKTDISIEEKVRLIQDAYKFLENKKDINCPSDVKYVENFDNNGRVVYKWPKYKGFIRDSIQSISRENPLPEKWFRIGSLKGSNFTTASNKNDPYLMNKLGLPYIKNKNARHRGSFNNEAYFDIIDAIKNDDFDTFNAIVKKLGKNELDIDDFSIYKMQYNRFINDIHTKIGNINAEYGLKGTVAPWIINGKIELEGGADQILMPLTGNMLKDLGIIPTIKRRKNND